MPSQPRAAHRALPSVATVGDAALVRVSAMIDEHFPGFGDLDGVSTVVIDVSGVTYMTSFGVARWLKAMASVPASVTDLYLVGCPPIFVDQLNMILNFGGAAKILSLVAPYTCTSCGAETNEIIDVLAEQPQLAQGVLPDKQCARCGGKLALDAIEDSYLACLTKYGASSIQPPAAQLLASSPAQLHEKVVRPTPRDSARGAVDRRVITPASKPKGSFSAVAAFVVVAIAIAVGAYLLVGPS